MKSIIDSSIERLKQFEATTIAKINAAEIPLPKKEVEIEQIVNTPQTDNTTAKTVMIGGAISLIASFFVGDENDNVLSTLLGLAGGAALLYGGVNYMKAKASPQEIIEKKDTPSYISGNEIDLPKFLNEILLFKDDFRAVITDNRDNIQKTIEDKVSNFDLKQKLEDISFFRAVPNISASEYIVQANQALSNGDIDAIQAVVATFKQNAIKALQDAVSEQKEKYQEILANL